MSPSEPLETLALTLAVLVPFIAFTWLMSFSPQAVVRWQAKFYHRIYKESRRLSDEEIDKLPQLPWGRTLMGKRSEFLQRGIAAPEPYARLIKGYRTIGLIGWVMLGCTLVAMLMAVVAQIQQR
jgi:hypothetical protein